MGDPAQLPFILKLLDDESSVVRDAVMRELTAFGSTLPDAIARCIPPIEPALAQRATELAAAYNRDWLRGAWNSWFTIRDDKEQLEAALDILSGFLSGYACKGLLGPRLDDVVRAFSESHPEGDAGDLAIYLFSTRKFEGARRDYYDPQNSNLLYVLEHKRGLPISLACVYILAARRLGLPVEGCNVPGHFFAIAVIGDGWRLVDCFNGGHVLDEHELRRFDREGVSQHDLQQLHCDAPTIVTRVLMNLLHAYRSLRPQDDREAKELDATRLLMLELVESMRQVEEEPPDDANTE